PRRPGRDDHASSVRPVSVQGSSRENYNGLVRAMTDCHGQGFPDFVEFPFRPQQVFTIFDPLDSIDAPRMLGLRFGMHLQSSQPFLQEEKTMKASSKPIPDGFHTVTASLTVKDAAKAIDFYKKALDAEEIMRMPGPD